MDNFKNNIKAMMEHLKELEGKLKDRCSKSHLNNIYTSQIYSIEELYNDKNLEARALYDEEILDEDFRIL